MYLKNLPPLHTPGPLWRFSPLHWSTSYSLTRLIYFLLASAGASASPGRGFMSVMFSGAAWWDWVFTMLKLILVLRNCPAREVVHTCIHTHTLNAPHPFLLQTARGLWLLELLSCLGAGACVFCPELHLMISVCPADGLRFCVEHSVGLVAIPRGESAPALGVLVRGGRAWSGPSAAAAVAPPPPPTPCCVGLTPRVLVVCPTMEEQELCVCKCQVHPDCWLWFSLESSVCFTVTVV